MFVFRPKMVVEKLLAHLVACMVRRREARCGECAARPSQARYVRPSLEGLEDRTLLSSYRFTDTGSAAGNWTTAGDWQVLGTNGIWSTATKAPGAADTVDIQSGPGPGMIFNSTTAQTIAGLTVEGNLEVDGKLTVKTMNTAAGSTLNLPSGGQFDVLGSASFGGGGTISGHIDDQGATVTFNPGSSMTLASGASLTGSLYNIYGSVNVTGALSQQATMVLDNTGSTPAGVLGGTGSITSGALVGTGSINDSGDFYWNGGTISLSGGVSFLANANLQLQGAEAKYLQTTLINQCNNSTIGGTGMLVIEGTAGQFDNLGNPNCNVTISSIITDRYGKLINDTNGFFDAKGTTTITGNFTNLGTLKVGGGAALTISELPTYGIVGTAILNGTLQLDGVLTLLGGGNGNLKSTSGFNELAGSGRMRIGNGTSTGTLTLVTGSSAILPNILEVTSTGTLAGGGQIQNNSKLILDIGSVTNIGSYLAGNSGILDLQASSATSYSSLTVAGAAQLSGTLELDFLNGYEPTSATVFVLLKASSLGAHFDSTPQGMNAAYSPTTVSVTQGTVIKIVYANGNVWYRVYASDGSSTGLLRDSNGNLLADYSYNAQGVLTAYDMYYSNGNVFHRVYAPDGSSTATLSNSSGTVANGETSIAYAYNAQGQTTSQTFNYTNGNVFTRTYSYNLDGSSAGSTATLSNSNGTVVSGVSSYDYSYNAKGQLTAYDVYYTNGNVYTRTYNADGSSKATLSNSSGTVANGETSIAYTYNAQSQITSQTFNYTNGNVFTRAYSYNPDGSLAGSTATLTNNSGTVSSGVTSYDYTYNAQGQLTAYDVYYSNGNVFHRVYAPDGSSTATVSNSSGTVASGETSIAYAYNAQGQITSQTFNYTNGNVFTRTYSYNPDGSSAGSTATLSNSSGTVIETYYYNAQGQLIGHSP